MVWLITWIFMQITVGSDECHMGKVCTDLFFPFFCPLLPVSGTIAGHRSFNNCGQQVSLEPTGMIYRNNTEFSYDIITEYRCELRCLFSDRETRAYVSHSLYRWLYVCGQCVGEMTELCVCKYSPGGQTPKKNMVSFIFYILTIYDHNF